MARLAQMAVTEFATRLRGSGGLRASLRALDADVELMVSDEQVLELAGPPEVLERLRIRYPMVVVHCEKLENRLREKGRGFSGTVDVWAEVRCLGDRMELVSRDTRLVTEALVHVLDQNRGEWGPGLMHAGGYQVVMGPVRLGGRCFLQTARVSVTLQASAD
jgi:hypothetical protein